jgi:hypothetical protein
MSGVGLPLSPSAEPLGISVERTPLAAVSIALQSERKGMETNTQYWLVTTKRRYCSEPATFAIAEHPAGYLAKNITESLIFAMPITEGQFDAYEKAYSGN